MFWNLTKRHLFCFLFVFVFLFCFVLFCFVFFWWGESFFFFFFWEQVIAYFAFDNLLLKSKSITNNNHLFAELCGLSCSYPILWNSLSLSLLPVPLCSGVLVPVRIQSIGQSIEMFDTKQMRVKKWLLNRNSSCETYTRVGWKNCGLKCSCNDIISAVDDFLEQWDPSIETLMEEVRGSQEGPLKNIPHLISFQKKYLD